MATQKKLVSLEKLTYYDGKIKAWVNNLMAGKIQIKSVANLPTTGESNVIYLVPNNGTGNNVKDEFIWVDGKFELIGTTAVDLSGYYTKTEITTLLAPYAKTADVAPKSHTHTASQITDFNTSVDSRVPITGVQFNGKDLTITGKKVNVQAATTEQGKLADSAVQPGTLTTTLAPYAKTADVATKAQGDKADTALQPDDIVEVTNEEIDALFV